MTAAAVRPYVLAHQAAVETMPGAGALTPLLLDPDVTDVLVNGGEVWVDKGAGLERVDLRAGGPIDARRLAQRLAAACGRRLDEACPFVDARLPDGTRLHAVLPPIATAGPYLSLRTVRHRALAMPELVGRGTVTAAGAEVLSAIVASRLSYLVSGGTGSGKTTLLASLLSLVPPTERIVIVEDSAELRPHHPHAVSLQGRTPNVEGAGAVSLRDLMRQALRMRPDRLVVGECRGAEVVDLLTVYQTNVGVLPCGHEDSPRRRQPGRYLLPHLQRPGGPPRRRRASGGGLPQARPPARCRGGRRVHRQRHLGVVAQPQDRLGP
jgi:pilus assembly protein CpaF